MQDGGKLLELGEFDSSNCLGAEDMLLYVQTPIVESAFPLRVDSAEAPIESISLSSEEEVGRVQRYSVRDPPREMYIAGRTSHSYSDYDLYSPPKIIN